MKTQLKNKNIKDFWIGIIIILFLSTTVQAQQKGPSVSNKQAKKEINAEQARKRERQGVEEKRVKKGSDKINSQAKYKLIPKNRKRNSEKSQKKYEETTSPHL